VGGRGSCSECCRRLVSMHVGYVWVTFNIQDSLLPGQDLSGPPAFISTPYWAHPTSHPFLLTAAPPSQPPLDMGGSGPSPLPVPFHYPSSGSMSPPAPVLPPSSKPSPPPTAPPPPGAPSLVLSPQSSVCFTPQALPSQSGPLPSGPPPHAPPPPPQTHTLTPKRLPLPSPLT